MGVKIMSHVIKIGRSIDVCGIGINDAIHRQGSLTRPAVSVSVSTILIMIFL